MTHQGTRSIVLPAITVIGVVVILGFILSTSIYKNLDRQSRLLTRLLNEKGEALIAAVQDVADIESDSMQPPRKLVELCSTLINKGGAVGLTIYRADFYPLLSLGEQPRLDLEQAGTPPATYQAITQTLSGLDVLEIVKPFSLGWMQGWSNSRGFIQLSLSMAEARQAERDDLDYTLFLGLILMAVGTAALYFIVVTQNYYLVNRTLKSIESYAANLVESMADGLVSFNETGAIVTMNRAAELLLGLEVKTAAGRRLEQVLDTEQNREFTEFVTNTSGRSIREVYLHNGKDLVLPVSLSRSDVIDSETGETTGSLVMIRDLSELALLRDQIKRSEKLASLGRLTAAVAHEIRNPLNAIRGFTQYLQGKFKPDSDERNYTGIMIKEIDRLDTVIRGMLEFARPMEPRLRPIAVDEILRETIALIQSDAQAQRVRITFTSAPGIPPVLLDGEQIKQVLLNLLLNALAAMPEGGEITVTIQWKAGDSTKRTIAIAVEDSGMGIRSEDVDKIFDPFFTTKPDGTGLGLAIAYRIIENHGGTITVHSELNRGCRFLIELPLR